VPLAAEIVAEPMAVTQAAEPPTGSPPASPADATPQIEDDSPMMAVLQATLRAEGLQREALRYQREMAQQAAPSAPAQPSRVEEYVNSLPGLSSHKRDFLKAHPSMLEPAQSNSLARHYGDAIRAGLKDDSAELDQYVLQRVQRDMDALAHRRQPVEAEPRPASPAPQRRPTIPMSAPVSRDIPMPSSGERVSNGVTLSPNEREMAHLSYRDLPKEEAERLYALNKMKLVRERAAGRYPERERG
jgi:hypothetical protein